MYTKGAEVVDGWWYCMHMDMGGWVGVPVSLDCIVTKGRGHVSCTPFVGARRVYC